MDDKMRGNNTMPDHGTKEKDCNHSKASSTDDGFINACKEVDKAAVGIGLIIADLFETVSLAAAHLPNLDLHSDLIDVVVDEDSILVRIVGLGETKGRSCDDGLCEYHSHRTKDRGFEEDDWYPEDYDDEEERVYDEY